MKTLAWAIVWVAVWYTPDIHFMVHGAQPSADALHIGVLVFLTVTGILLWQTFNSRA
jgi:hypothetical protein